MRTRKTVVILISGKAGSGKTTVKDILIQRFTQIPGMEFFPYSFANPIKYMAQAFIGWDKKKDEAGRKLLQNLGKDGREYDENIWVKHFLNQMDKSKSILPPSFAIIDDWRFPNELAYLRNNPLLNTVTIRIFGRGGLSGEVSSDVSENSLPEVSAEYLSFPNGEKETSNLWYDFQIDNSGDTELLKNKLDLVLAELEKQYIVE